MANYAFYATPFGNLVRVVDGPGNRFEIIHEHKHGVITNLGICDTLEQALEELIDLMRTDYHLPEAS